MTPRRVALLLGCGLVLIAFAEANRFDAYAWQIPWTLGPFFNRRGRWRDYTATQQTALAAAESTGLNPSGIA